MFDGQRGSQPTTVLPGPQASHEDMSSKTYCVMLYRADVVLTNCCNRYYAPVTPLTLEALLLSTPKGRIARRTQRCVQFKSNSAGVRIACASRIYCERGPIVRNRIKRLSLEVLPIPRQFVGIHAAKSAEGPAHMKEYLSLYDPAALVAERDVVHYILLLAARGSHPRLKGTGSHRHITS